MTWVPGEELLKRVWESVEKLGTGMLSPAQIRREGKARAEIRRLEMLNEATAQMDVAEILAGRARMGSGGEVVRIASAHSASPLLLEHAKAADKAPAPLGLPEPASEHQPLGEARAESQALVEQARAVRDSQAIKHLVNLRETVRMIEEDLASAPDSREEAPANSSTIDPDWLDDWREGASRTSSDQLRGLWARLLIEETKSVGSFSLRTLTFLRTLDPADAKLIAKVAPLVVNGEVIIREDQSHSIPGIDFSDLLPLEDMGVISGASGLGLSLTIPLQVNKPHLLQMHGGKGVRLLSQADTSLEVPVIVFSRIGKEIVKLGVFETPEPYLVFVGREFQKRGVDAKRVMCESIGDGLFRLSNERPIEMPA